jgi:hypothetical protein
LLLGQQGLGHFFRRRNMKNTAPTTLSAIQVASQSTCINAQLYSTCDYQEGQKNQLTLLKLMQTRTCRKKSVNSSVNSEALLKKPGATLFKA